MFVRLEEITELYSKARGYAKTYNNLNIDKVVSNLSSISDYVKTLYNSNISIMEQVKCKNLYESVDNIILIIESNGLTDPRCLAFFGLSNNATNSPSFKDVISGEAKVNITPDEVDKLVNKKDELENKPISNELDKKDLNKDIISDNSENIDKENDIKNYVLSPSMEPESLDDFIGQSQAVKILKDAIKVSRIKGVHHIDNVLLFGRKGLGKTTLMKLVAKELDAQFEYMDAASFENSVSSQRSFQNFLINISQLNKPVVIAIDEIHALPKSIQTSLLTLLNNRVYSYLDKNGVTHNIPINEFTFIGATTDSQDVLPTIKDRCSNLTFYLRNYTYDELTKIFLNKFTANNLLVDQVILDECINRCRSSIRQVNDIVKGITEKALLRLTNKVTMDMVDEYFKERNIDPIGLTVEDLKILNAIKEEPTGVVSEDTLAARAHIDVKVLKSDFEPYLLSIGFISITPKGRVLTQKALDYLKPKLDIEAETNE